MRSKFVLLTKSGLAILVVHICASNALVGEYRRGGGGGHGGLLDGRFSRASPRLDHDRRDSHVVVENDPLFS